MHNSLVTLEGEDFIIDMMYARPNNMVGRAVYEEIGFGHQALVHEDVYKALMTIVPVLREKHLKMRVCDAYRPPLAHNKLLEIIPFEGFFAKNYERSNHCHGTAIDICLTDEHGHNLSYPTEIDAYEPRFSEQVRQGNFSEFQKHLIKARHDYMGATAEEIANRNFLKEVMESHGFESIPHEWWHYNLTGYQRYPVIGGLV